MKSTIAVLTSIMNLALAAPVAHNEQDASTDIGLLVDLALQVEDEYFKMR